MASKTTTLPDRDEMSRRLGTVDFDPYTKKELVPMLLRSAGNELSGVGVVMMIQLSIYDLTAGLPSFEARVISLGSQPYVKEIVSVLVDDEVVKKDAFDMTDIVDTELRK